MEKVNLTDLEKKVIGAFDGCDEYDETPYSTVTEISATIGETTKVVRGVISSLSKKGLVDVQDDFFSNGVTIVLLTL